MLKSPAPSVVRLRGVRHNNLKNFDLDLPLNRLIVITGLSGSGKSSLAFDTLFAEGQRRYIETFSPYARQFFDRMDKPQVDSIEGIPPAIAIEQRNSVKTTRSTVGTLTEICDYMKMLWPHLARLRCRKCGQVVCKESPGMIWERLGNLSRRPEKPEVLITFDLPLTEKLSMAECLALIARQGYQRLLVGDAVRSLDEATSNLQAQPGAGVLTVIQDRVRLTASQRPRFVEACEQAYHFGKGKLTVHEPGLDAQAPRIRHRFSNHLHCASCDLDYAEPSPALFSFNHPVGACPTCRGFGRVISIDYDLALPDRSRTLREGVVKPWLTGVGAECQEDLLRVCAARKIPLDVPFEKLPRHWQDLVIDGDPAYGKDPAHQWPHAWYGLKGYFRWLESRAYKMHVRVLLSRYRAYTPCPDCRGRRFQPEALLYRLEQPALDLAEFYHLPVRDALNVIEALAGGQQLSPSDPLALVLEEVQSRLRYLHEVGLGYLSLDRPTRSLSGGETERVNLTTCLGTRLVNTLYVLDEPSVGLHPRDTERLVRILERLRDAGNTVLVVEHEASVMRAADQIVDLGPGHGATGGQVVFQGSYAMLTRSPHSLTGQYLSGRRQIEIPRRRPVQESGPREALGPVRRSRRTPSSASPSPAAAGLVIREAAVPFGVHSGPGPTLKLSRATRHNLRDLTVEIPLRRLVCITGVSGSGKTTLVRELLLPTLASSLKSELPARKASDRLVANSDAQSRDEEGDDERESAPGTFAHPTLEGAQHLSRVVLVDQSILGKTPRSNPAVYSGAFDHIRELFAHSTPAKQRGLNASAFSFNSSQGQCARCRGAGFEKIEMQFLSDVFIRCPDCQGRRYREHILEVRLSGAAAGAPARSIADLLEATVEEAIEFLAGFAESRPAQRAAASLAWLREVGLGYLQLGQPINTLSGGESQRLKLVKHLAESFAANPPPPPSARQGRPAPEPTLFLFDEPTTGLHFEDVRVLLKVLQRLVDTGHSVLVIEHNLEVIKCADWLIDLGPDAGDQGGQVVVSGTPEKVAACTASHTGRALREILGKNAPMHISDSSERGHSCPPV